MSAKPAFTPGPWTVEYNCTNLIVSPDAEIATVEGDENAALISAAPDLFSVSRRLTEWLERHGDEMAGGRELARIGEAARKAVRQAEGEAVPKPGIHEGETCNRDDNTASPCDGVIQSHPPKGCSCHISPPCSACTAPRNYCPYCGWHESDTEEGA